MYPHVQALALKLFIEAEALGTELKVLEGRIDATTDTVVKDRLEEQAKQTDTRRKMLRHSATHLESGAGMTSVVKVAAGHPTFRVRMDQLDQHPHWLNVQNGSLDLETGELLSHQIDHLITKVAGTTYDPEATCPTWETFLGQIIPDPEVRDFLQRSVGYALSDDVSERCFWIFHGVGRNGKGTFIETVRAMLGDYADTAAASVLMAKSHGDDKRNDVAVLRGARFVACSESDDGQRLAEALIKQLAGGNDIIKARLMYAEFFSFMPTFKIFLATNHKPKITGTDDAIWDRVRLVPFTVRIDEAKQDRALGAKLRQELPGILNWALAGYRAWRKDGLQTPDVVRMATSEYRQEMDVLGNWLAECCELRPSHRANADPLYQSYRTWANNNSHGVMSARTFGTKLGDRGFTRVKSDGRMVYEGLRLAAAPPGSSTWGQQAVMAILQGQEPCQGG
jgi:putative DNA primase/helicase